MTIERVHQNALAIVEAAHEYDLAMKKYDALKVALSSASKHEVRSISEELKSHEVKVFDLRSYMDALLDDIHKVVSDE